jgi:uncharacterized membrane protein
VRDPRIGLEQQLNIVHRELVSLDMNELLPGLSASPSLHPIFVHFPIAFWIAAFGFWIASVLLKKDRLWSVGRWLLNIGVVGALISIGSGLLAEHQLGHRSPGHDIVHLHRNLMLAAGALALLTALVAQVLRNRPQRARLLLFVPMIGVVALTVLGADRGALVASQHAGHEHARITDPANEPRPIAPPADPKPADPKPAAPDHAAHDHEHAPRH